MKNINYIVGDATQPVRSGTKFIIHVCNDMGVWGAGFVMALSKRWKQPEKEYRLWYEKKFMSNASGEFKLGAVQFVNVKDDRIVVCNMIGQHGVGVGNDGVPPIRYKAIEKALEIIATYALKVNATVHAPRFGAGLAMGSWSTIEQLIIKNLSAKDIDVTIYDLK